MAINTTYPTDDGVPIDACFVVAIHGHVWACRNAKIEGGFLHCHNARVVRDWGSDKGLNQLVPRPLKSGEGAGSGTVLDALTPLVSVAYPSAVIAIIPIDASGWEKHLT